MGKYREEYKEVLKPKKIDKHKERLTNTKRIKR